VIKATGAVICNKCSTIIDHSALSKEDLNDYSMLLVRKTAKGRPAHYCCPECGIINPPRKKAVIREAWEKEVDLYLERKINVLS